jgi:acyl carrier protein
VGLAVAEWLAGRGARHLILQGRSAPGAAAQRAVSALREQGVSVDLWSVDVADEAALRRTIAARRENGGASIRGVMHAAGVWRDLPMVQLGSDDLATVLAPKITGTLALERCLGADLDCFVSFSSMSAVLPAHGQANYAAANAFLDAHAHWRRALGRPALSVNWGPWSGVGFGASEHGRKAHERLESFGLRRIAPAPALAALGALLERGWAQAAVVTIDWPLLARVDAPLAQTPFLAEVAGPFVREKGAPEPIGEAARQIAESPLAEQPALVREAVAAIVARVFRVTPAELRRAEPLSNLGLDSLMAVEIKNRIRAELGLDVPLARFLEGASVTLLSEFVVDALADATAHVLTPPATEEFTL